MKLQSLGMTLFCAATLVAALPVDPATGPVSVPCIKPEDVSDLGEVSGPICGDEPKNEKRQKEEPSLVGGPVGSVIGDLSKVVHR
ncbi:hypothetical protein BDV38DRAFT_280074 [Aspergillus pseudotamarii]|uniref:Uncharacterized protein n=1 Tax=Aspergillus pseudotamarii TaxID=132259 RepID=A0A5N6T2P4_ASPPS|nr:uncharacterized protein BDV38DRAFT_280074 [Aspergillus pseudotamarii]KAE8140576.1 hypothetical protein BDV38DRAFT_280074 [Aspergillus pseudotamarii]